MGLNRRIALNTGFSFALRIASVILGFFSLGLTTRFLGQEGFGIYSAVLAYAYIVSFFGDLGLYSLMVRDISQAGSSARERFVASNIFTLRLFALLFFLSAGILVASLFFDHKTLPPLLLILASLQYLFLGLTQALAGIFQKHLAIKFLAFSELFGRITTLALLFFYASYIGQGTLIYKASLTLSAFAIGSLVIILLNILWARKLVGLTLDTDFVFWRKVFKEAFPIGLSIILTVVYFKLDTLLLAFLRSDREAGLYNAAYRILEVIIFFPAAFIGLLMPQLSRFALVDKEAFWRFFKGGAKALFISAFPASVGIFFEAESIIRFVAGKDFLAASGALQLLAGAVFMISFGSLFGNALIAKRKQWLLVKIYGLGALLNVAANLIAIPRWGYVGAALTTVLTETLVTLLLFLSLDIHISNSFVRERCAPVLCSTAFMGLFLYMTNLSLLPSVLGAIAVYGGALLLLKGVKKEDIAFIIQS